METTIAEQQNVNEKYITFTMAQESYGIRITEVREITPLPKLPDFIRELLICGGRLSR